MTINSAINSINDYKQSYLPPPSASTSPPELKAYNSALQILSVDALLEIFSFLDIPSEQTLRLVSRSIRILVDSTKMWNARALDLVKLTRDTHLSLDLKKLLRDMDGAVSKEEKKALYIYTTVLRNVQAFFNAYSPDTKEYPFTLSTAGDMRFADESFDYDRNYILVTEGSERIKEGYQDIAKVYSSLHALERISPFVIMQQERACFYKESEEGIRNQMMRLFLRTLNSFTSIQGVSSEELLEGLKHPETSVTFEDVTREECTPIYTSAQVSPLSENKSNIKSRLAHLCGKDCPVNVSKRILLPFFERKYENGELVVIRQLDNNLRFGFINSKPTKVTSYLFSEKSTFLKETNNDHVGNAYYITLQMNQQLLPTKTIYAHSDRIYPVPDPVIEALLNCSVGKALSENTSTAHITK